MEPPRRTLLVVDDSPTNLTLITEVLRERYKLAVATRGTRAVELARERLPDLILLDVEMPEMDGYMLTRQVKSDPRLSRLPVIMHSSLSGTQNLQLGKSVGVDEYVSKFEPQKLADAIARQLREAA